MGNTLLPPQTSSQILNKYWQPISGGLYRNRATHQVIKQKKLTFRTEDQMKYVFNCLLKRMNNYHPGVIKIVYLRKMVESLPLCECGKKFVVLVYVEHMEMRLKSFVEGEDRLVENFSQRYNHKCICLSLLKASQYLKQRYGPFRVTQHNTWIQVPKQLKKSDLIQYNTLAPGTKFDYAHSIKLKLWISSEEEQNFPDESCQQMEMVLSIVKLLMHWVVPKRLCKCYGEAQGLEKYFQVGRVKELWERMRQDHESGSDTATMTKTLSNVEVINKQPAPFQRMIRSFSSNDPGHHPSYPHNSHQIISENFQLTAQRKYTSIEYVRKQPVEHGSGVSEKKVSRTPHAINQVCHSFSPTAKPLLMQPQLPKHHSFRHAKTHQIPVKNDHSLTKNQYKAMVKFQVPPQTYHTQKHPQSSIYPKPLLFNPKLKYRHGNSIDSRPIIVIADLLGQVNAHIPSITISSQNYTPKEETMQRSQSPSCENQIPMERENLVREEGNRKVSKINLWEDLSKRHVEISVDKGTNPTDRSKIDISSKSQEKKQPQALNSSRKNISVIPIRLYSTNEATVNESFKPILHSQGYINMPNSTPVFGQLQIPKIKDSSIIHQENSKKQSASSRKSQQNYITYQNNLATSKTKLEISKFVPSKLSSNVQKHQILNQKLLQRPHGNTQSQRQKSYSFINKIQALGIATSNGDMGRLRQSEYIVTGQNSLINSKSISIGESIPLMEEKGLEIGSLKEMEAKFPTLKDLENYEDIGEQKSQSHLFIQPQTNSLQKIPHNDNSDKDQRHPQQIMTLQTKPINLQSYHQSRESSSISNKKYSNISLIQNQKPKSHSFLSNPGNPRASMPTEQLQNILSDNMSSIIFKEKHEELLLDMQKVTEQEYKVKVSSGSQRQKMNHKKMSNPTFDKQYMKTKALKVEFSQLLGEPKENSFKVLTESEDKLMKLDRNQGQETYSVYNQSEYNISNQLSKRQSQHENLAGLGETRPPLPRKEHGKQNKWRKPFSKHQLEKELQEKKQGPKTPPNQQALRLTSSGHEDNSIKQKVRNKKAEFAELKNQMNSLLL